MKFFFDSFTAKSHSLKPPHQWQIDAVELWGSVTDRTMCCPTMSDIWDRLKLFQTESTLERWVKTKGTGEVRYRLDMGILFWDIKGIVAHKTAREKGSNPGFYCSMVNYADW